MNSESDASYSIRQPQTRGSSDVTSQTGTVSVNTSSEKVAYHPAHEICRPSHRVRVVAIPWFFAACGANSPDTTLVANGVLFRTDQPFADIVQLVKFKGTFRFVITKVEVGT